MKKINLLIVALVIVISGLALTIFMQKKPLQENTVSPQIQKTPPKPDKQTIVHYPVPVQIKDQILPMVQEERQETAKASPVLPKQLPTVQQSDKSIQQAMSNLNIKKSLSNLVFIENFIQRFVVTIDNLPEKRVPRAHLPLAPIKGRYIVAGTTEAPQTSSQNQARYNEHVQLIENLDQDLVIKIYIHFYPLFQTAFEQLGYRNAYFNDRLINVIDHLLETPSPTEPILLSQPAVLYIYADPLLEKLSSGQKTLLRVGPNHRGKLLRILKSYREKLTNLQP